LAVLATTLPATRRLGRQGLSVLLCALLFGLFHLSWSKLLPTALLGLGFGAAAVWAGSLWPAMSMHFTNNALVVLCVRAGLDEAPSAARSLHGLGGKWLLAGTLAALLGCWLLGQGQPAGQPGKSL
jgi:membrane protease YdiL (CAAX protease family)